MDKEYKYEIISGINYNEIKEYFESISDDKEKNCVFIGNGWKVSLMQLPENLYGNIKIPCTRVMFFGDEKTCKDVIYKYRKRFMRGGG